MTDAELIMDALALKAERTVGPDVQEKARERGHLLDLRNLVESTARGDDPGSLRPTAAELRDALGDPDDKELREALASW